MINLRDVTLQLGGHVLFQDVTFSIAAGKKVGIVGANGAGKSSLLSLIYGDLETDRGECEAPRREAIARVEQEIPETSRPTLEYVLDGDTEFRRIMSDLEQAEEHNEGEKIAELHADLQHIDGYSAHSRAAQLLHGLGVADRDHENPVSSFSGGWRMRFNLARALMRRSSLLMLDEPTNHLDLDAVIWLEQWLQRYAGTLLLITHDRDFLDATVDSIIHIEHQHIKLYGGNFTTFEETRAMQLAQQQAVYEKQQREMAHMQGFIDRFRAKATKARQAQSRVKALERMQKVSAIQVTSPFHFTFPETKSLPFPLLTTKDIKVGYSGTPVLEKVKLYLAPGDRIGLLGPNGAGKTTLLKTIAGFLEPVAGEIAYVKGLKIGYYAQHQLEQLHNDKSPVQHLLKLTPNLSEGEARKFLGGFNFRSNKAMDPIRHFSGGEKARLALALLVWQGPNLLLLDEPTNHLDLEMREALSLALQDYEGALVVVSHDRYLLRSTVDRFALVANGGLSDFDGDLEDYRRWLLQFRKEDSKTKTSKDDAQKQKESSSEATRRALETEVKRLESQLAQLHRKLNATESQLANNNLYQNGSRADELKELYAQQETLKQQIHSVEQTWLKAASRLEQS